MGKKGTMLSLDEDLVEQAKSLNINMSNVMNTTLQYLIEGSSLQPVRTDLLLTTQDIKRVRDAIDERVLELEGLKYRLEQLLLLETELSIRLAAADRDTALAKGFEQLRSMIVTRVSNDEILKSATVGDMNKLLNMVIDNEWLDSYRGSVMKNEQV